jgi:hypothetical protein
MSKILKVKIKRDHKPTGTHYTYPPEYDASKIQVLTYESMGDFYGVVERGDKDEFCIGVVKDEDVPSFLLSPDIVEIVTNEAKILGRKWRPQKEIISDDKVIITILAKLAKGEELSQKEKDAIDPNNLEYGINKSQLFDDLLDRTINDLNK